MTNTVHIFYDSRAIAHHFVMRSVVGMITGTGQLKVINPAGNLIFGGYSARGCP